MRDVNKLAIASCDRGFPDAKSDAGEGAPGIREHPVKILLVEDNAGDARLLREMLRNDPPESYNLTHFSRMSEAVAHLALGGFHIGLLDLGLPDALARGGS